MPAVVLADCCDVMVKMHNNAVHDNLQCHAAHKHRIRCKLCTLLHIMNAVSDASISSSTTTHQGLKGLSSCIKAPDLDSGVLATTEQILCCLGQTQDCTLHNPTRLLQA